MRPTTHAPASAILKAFGMGNGTESALTRMPWRLVHFGLMWTRDLINPTWTLPQPLWPRSNSSESLRFQCQCLLVQETACIFIGPLMLTWTWKRGPLTQRGYASSVPSMDFRLMRSARRTSVRFYVPLELLTENKGWSDRFSVNDSKDHIQSQPSQSS